MPETDILIVGGGPAGLSTAGALKSIGLDAIILDQDDRIGGSWARRYDRLHLHTVRAFSGLAGLPIPRHFPKYMSKDQYAAYLQDYAKHFQINYQPKTPVARVRPGNGNRRGLRVETDRESWDSRVVVVATGQFGAPIIPEWPGLTEFQGQVIHSAKYKTGRDFAGRRVLVVGVGNSGAEIAADLAEQGAAFVAVSIRTPPPVVPRDLLGTPAQVFGILLSRLSPALADRIGNFLASTAIGDLTKYGLGKPAWLPFSAKRIPIIDVGFVENVKAARIQLRPNLTRFTSTGAVFADGREDAFDVVIAATGFKTALNELVEIPGVLNERGLPLAPQGTASAQPGLYFMGYVDTHRGHLYEARLASQPLAKRIQNYLSAP